MKKKEGMTSKTLINCTPHEIVLVNIGGEVTQKIPPSETQIRVVSSKKPARLPFEFLNVPVVESTTFDNFEVVGPVPEEGAFLVVSMAVGEYFKNKPSKWWIFGPDSGPGSVVRDSAGRITGVLRLIFYAAPTGRPLRCFVCTVVEDQEGYCRGCGEWVQRWQVDVPGTEIKYDGNFYWERREINKT